METKVCRDCSLELPASDFSKLSKAKDGLQPRCKPCAKARGAAWYQKNKERRLAKCKEWHANNKERHNKHCREKQQEQKDVMYPLQRRWKQENKDRRAATDAKRRAAKLQRTPQWSDMSAIAEFYVEAKRLEELTGIQFHVDHIVPLQGELVSGLHVPANLQLLPAHENLSKSNSFEVAA